MDAADNPLGDGSDMQLMGKLALSLAVILLVSWAYKFYGSRGPGSRRRRALDQSNGNAGQPTDSQTPAGACIKRKAELRLKKEQVPERRGGEGSEDPENGCPERREYPAENSKTDTSEIREYSGRSYEKETGERRKRYPENSGKETWECHKHPPRISEKKTVEGMNYDPENLGKDILEKRGYCPEAASANIQDEVLRSAPHSNCHEAKERAPHRDLRLTLAPQPSPEQGQTIPTGRRSPCTLRKLEQSAGVQRELRQDLGHPGTFSSFRSKVEIRVEDADLLLERPGRRQVEVRGKIYDFYAESSSQSSDYQSGSDGPASRQHENLQRRGLAGSQPVGGDGCAGSRSPKSPVAPGSRISPLITRDVAMRDSSPICFPALSSGDQSLSLGSVADEQPVGPRANFSQTPPEGTASAELESLMGRLDLGNCLRALTLARKHKHASLEESAMRVMSDNYLQVLQEPGLYGRLNVEDREQIQSLRTKGRQYLTVADIDPQDWMKNKAMAGSSDTRTSSGLYYYDDNKDTWHHLCPIPKEVVSKDCAICTMDNYLFVAVGCEGVDRYAMPSRKVFCYNPATSAWTEVCPMNEARPQCKLVALLGHVYAIGGEGLWTVERYDPRADRWAFVAPLPGEAFATAHRATACNGELFVLGGAPRCTLLRYSPRADAWRQSPIAGRAETTAEMVAVRSSLYRFDVSPARGISVHRFHTTARLWYECCSRRLAHCPAFLCAAAGDVVYCVSRQFAARLLADRVSPAFDEEDPSVLSEAGGVLFPFTLVLPHDRLPGPASE